MEFQVGDKVFLKVALVKGLMRFENKGKLSLRFIGPFEILDCVKNVSYRLALPPSLSRIHNVFHVSMLKKYVPYSSHVLDCKPLQLEENLTYEERLIQILDREIKELRNTKIPLFKVLWRNSSVEEATWEREEKMKNKHPELFSK